MSDYTTEEIDEIKRSNNIQSRKISEFQEYILLLEKTLGIHKKGSKIVCKTKSELKSLLKEKEEKEQKASATNLTIAEEVDLIETRVAKASEKAV